MNTPALRQRISQVASRRLYSSTGAALTKDFDLVRGFETICLHGGYLPDETTSRGVPLYRTAPYCFKNTEHAANLFALKELGNIYTRLMNPTTDVMEKRVSMMHGVHELSGLGFSSGTAAIFNTIINLAEAGDNIVASKDLYGGTYTQFNDIIPKLGINVKFVDVQDVAAVEAAIDDKTRAIFCETASNPSLEISPLEELGALSKDYGLPLIVDDTFTTPYLCKPMDWGATIVVSSLTKWLGGHGTGVGGVVVAKDFDWGAGKHPLFSEPDTSYGGLRWGLDLPDMLAPLAFVLRMRTVPLRNLGSVISPDNSWMFLQGIETLPLRMDRHCENSMKVAEWLQQQPNVEWVRYPGLKTDPMYENNLKYLKGKGGSMVTFEIAGGAEAGKNFIDSLKLISHVANVGDAKTLAINPATTTHSQMNEDEQRAAGITPGLVRLSIGIETIDDIIADLDQALN
eukprot:Nitzschia sp. Nitz4//scaffold96_size78090//3693//5146//NITZ4_005482-RA/size78090-augustus-gene-0.10-mRNA-1//-1//CDS//3329560537//8733//frame0